MRLKIKRIPFSEYNQPIYHNQKTIYVDVPSTKENCAFRGVLHEGTQVLVGWVDNLIDKMGEPQAEIEYVRS